MIDMRPKPGGLIGLLVKLQRKFNKPLPDSEKTMWYRAIIDARKEQRDEH